MYVCVGVWICVCVGEWVFYMCMVVGVRDVRFFVCVLCVYFVWCVCVGCLCVFGVCEFACGWGVCLWWVCLL